MCVCMWLTYCCFCPCSVVVVETLPDHQTGTQRLSDGWLKASGVVLQPEKGRETVDLMIVLL